MNTQKKDLCERLLRLRIKLNYPLKMKKNLSLLLVFFLFASCNVFRKKELSVTPTQSYNISSAYLDAYMFNLAGRYNEALKIFKDIANTDKNHAASRYEIARIYGLHNKHSEALKYAKQASEIDPDNKWYDILIIEISESTGNFNEVISRYKKLITLYPDDYSMLLGLANSYLNSGNYQKSIEVLNDVEKMIGVSDMISLQKSQLYLMLQDQKNALNELIKLSDAFPSDTEYMLLVADFYLQYGDFDEAINCYNEVLIIDAANIKGRISVAEAYLRTGQNEKAIESLTILFKEPTVNLDSKIGILSYYYDWSENVPELKTHAYSLINLLIENYPNEPKVLSIYGDFLYRDGKYSDAAEQWKKVIETDPSRFLIWEFLLFALAESQDFNELANYAGRAVSYFPEQHLPYYFAGYANFELKKYNEAIPYLESGVIISKGNKNIEFQLWNLLGECYNKIEEHINSDSAFENALKINPNNEYVLNNYSYYLSLRKERLEDALNMSAKSLKIQPESPHFLDTYGWILYGLSRFDEAKDYIYKAMKNSEEPSATILDHYGDVLFKLNDIDGAKKYWNKAIDAGGDEEQILEKIK